MSNIQDDDLAIGDLYLRGAEDETLFYDRNIELHNIKKDKTTHINAPPRAYQRNQHITEQGIDTVECVICMVIFAPNNKSKDPLVITSSLDHNLNIRSLVGLQQECRRVDAEHSGNVIAMMIFDPTTIDSESMNCTYKSPVLFSISKKDNFVNVWDLETFVIIHTLGGGHADGITSLALFNPRNPSENHPPMLATGSKDSTVTVWNLAETKISCTSELHSSEVTCVTTYSQLVGGVEVGYVASGSKDKTIAICSLISGRKSAILKDVHKESITALSVQFRGASAHLPLLFSGSSDMTVALWDLSSFCVLHTIRGAQSVSHLYFYSPDGVSVDRLLESAQRQQQVGGTIAKRPEHHVLPESHQPSSTQTSVATQAPREEAFPSNTGDKESGVRVNELTQMDKNKSSLMIVLSQDKQVAVVWDLNTCARLRVIEEGISAMCVLHTFSGNTTPVMIAALEDGIKDIWKLVIGTEIPFNPPSRPFLTKLRASQKVLCVAVTRPASCSTMKGTKPLLVTGHPDNTVTVWDVSSGEKKAILSEKSKQEITAIAIYDPEPSGSSPRVIAASRDKSVTIWLVNSSARAKYKLTGSGHSDVITAIAVYPGQGLGSALIVTASADRSAIIWKLETGERVGALRGAHTRRLNCLAIYTPLQTRAQNEASCNPLVLTAGDDRSVVVWDLFTRQRSRYKLIGHMEAVTSMCIYSPQKIDEAPLVVTGSLDKTIVMWDLRTGEKVFTIKATYKIRGLDIYAPPNAAKKGITPLIASRSKRGVQLWDISTGEVVRSLSEVDMDVVDKGKGSFSMALFPYSYADASLPVIITASSERQTAEIWNPNSNMYLLHTMEKAHYSDVNGVASFVQQPQRVPMAVTVSRDSTVALWNLQTGIKGNVLKGGHSGSIVLVGVHQGAEGDASLIVTAGSDRRIVVWDATTGAVLHTISRHTREITSLAIVQGRKEAITGSFDGSAVVWDIATGERLFALAGDGVPQPVESSAKAATKYSALPERWMYSKHMVTNNRLNAPGVTAVTTFGDNRDTIYAAIATVRNVVLVWNLNTRQQVLVIPVYARVSAMVGACVSGVPFPHIITAGSADAHAWNATTGVRTNTYSGHQEDITALCVYSSTVNRARPLLLSGSKGKSVIVWNLVSGERLRILTVSYRVLSLAVSSFSDDGATFLVMVGGKTTRPCVLLQYAFDYMPLQYSVHALFVRDSETKADQKYKWNRIWNISRGHSGFWNENYRLFSAVFSLKNTDVLMIVSFFETFAAVLPRVIHKIPQVKGMSLLEYVLCTRIPVHKVILAAWSIALRSPCTTFTHQVFHPCFGFSKNGLILLAKLFPSEFIEFVSSIQMVKSHSLVHSKCRYYPFPHPQAWIMAGMKPAISSNLWSQAGYFTDNASAGAQAVTAYMLPLTEAADTALLKAYVDTSIALDDLSVFENDVGMAAFQFAWVKFGRLVHISAFVRYSLFLTLFTAYVVTYSRLMNSSSFAENFMAWFMQDLVLVFVAFYVYEELVQLIDAFSRKRQLEASTKTRQALAVSTFPGGKPAARAVAGTTTGSVRSDVPNPAVRAPSISTAAMGARAKRGSLIDSIPSTGDGGAGGADLADEVGSVASGMTDLNLRTVQRLMHPTYARSEASLPASRMMVEEFSLNLATVSYIRLLRAGRWSQLLTKLSHSKLGSVVQHFSEFWNTLDALVIVFVTSGTILRIAWNRETDNSRCLLAVASVFAWFKLLYFMRPFKSSGLLVSMILQIMSDIKYFLVVLAIALSGFACAFWAISYPDRNHEFGTLQNAFLNSYQYMLGQGISIDFEGTASPELGVLLLVLFMLFMMILMLNLLIALMGDSFSNIKSKGLAHWRRERAAIMLEQYSMVPQRLRDEVREFSHIHVLRTFALAQDSELTDKQLLLSVKKNMESKLQEAQEKNKCLEDKLNIVLAWIDKKDGGDAIKKVGAGEEGLRGGSSNSINASDQYGSGNNKKNINSADVDVEGEGEGGG